MCSKKFYRENNRIPWMNEIWGEKTLGESVQGFFRQIRLGFGAQIRGFILVLQHVTRTCVHRYRRQNRGVSYIQSIFVPRENGDYHLEDRPTPNTWKREMFFSFFLFFVHLLRRRLNPNRFALMRYVHNRATSFSLGQHVQL